MMLTTAIPIALSLAALLCVAILVRAALWHLPHLGGLPAPLAPPAQPLPAVSIVVPARNEERRRSCCTRLAPPQRWPSRWQRCGDTSGTRPRYGADAATQRTGRAWSPWR
jgi:hypothetical protein